MIHASGSRSLMLVLALVGVVFLLTPAGGAYPTRQDPNDTPRLEAFLAWSSGVGALTWSSAPTEDPGGSGSNPAKEWYASTPLDHAVFVNPSRYIEVDIYTSQGPTSGGTGSSCSGGSLRIGARLYAGTTLLGAVMANHQEFQQDANGIDPPARFPPDPPGYGVCRLRLHPEMSVIPEGTVLNLTLQHPASTPSTTYAFGMAGDHRSVVRIPYFSDDEVPYRFPSYAHLSGTASGAAGVAGRLLTGAGLGGLTAVVARGRRRGAVALVGLLVAGSLGGCLSHRSAPGGADPLDAPGRTADQSYQRGRLSAAGYGSLIGQVIADDVSQPLLGAHASLLGTNRSATTDSYGRFVFKDLEPGALTLRIDQEGFQSYEAEVEIVKDLITRVNVTLLRLGSLDASQRPHLHDYWGGTTERTLMDHVPMEGVCSAANLANLFYCGPANQEVFSIPPPDPSSADYNSILPGTYDVNVTIDWDPKALGLATVALWFQANNDPSIRNVTILGPRGPGVPFHIATSWEMEDPGHQRFSTWLFTLDTFDPTNADQQKRAVNQISYSGLQVTMKINKGTVPYEPAHPDPWKGAERLTVYPERLLEAKPYTGQVGTFDGHAGQINRWDLVWLPSERIPPGTTWLEVTANATRELNPRYPLDLRYHPGGVGGPALKCWSNMERPEAAGQYCDGPDYLHAPQPTEGGLSRRWVVPITEEQADQHYAVRTFWIFGLRADQEPANVAASQADYAAASAGAPQLGYRIALVAHRGPVP